MQDLKSPRYDGVELDITVQVPSVRVNFNPIAFNRLLRFFRFVKYPEVTYEQKKLEIMQAFKRRIENLH